MSVILQVLTLFLLMLCGLVAVRSKILDEKGIQSISTFLLNFALPALTIVKMETEATPELLMDLGLMFLLALVVMALSSLIGFLIFRKEEAKRRSVLVSLTTVSNCGFMGYPVVVAALGEEALIYAVIYNAAFTFVCWTLGSFTFGGLKAVQPGRLMRSPVLLSVLFGLLLFLTGWRLPGFVNSALDMLGATTTPLAMFVIGARLITLRPEHLTDRSLLLACALRLVLLPLLVLPLQFTPLSSLLVSILYLSTAMPAATTTVLQSDLFHADSGLSSRGIALSTALSILTIPLMLLLL